MFGLGAGEIVLILVVILVIFGPGRLPELGSALGEGIKNFKKGYRDSKSLDVTPPDVEPLKPVETPEGVPVGPGAKNQGKPQT